jgi:hypothetical protein
VRRSSLAFAAAGLLSAAVVASAAGQGCALPGFVLVTNDAGADAADGGPTGCMGATYPDPPGGADDGSALPNLVFAVHSIDLGDMGTVPGYDLDHVCTCFDDAGPSCVGSSSMPSTYCDQPPNTGVDNQSAKLFQLFKLANMQFGSPYFTAEANDGKWSLLIKVDGYNGMPDDPKVEVSLYASKGLGKTPLWDGKDVWPVTAQSVYLDGGVLSPSFVSNGAYVAGGVLVATMPTTELTLAGSSTDTITVRFRAGVITAQLVNAGTTCQLTGGVIAARWAIKDVFAAISSYRDNMGQPFCTTQLVWSTVKGTICKDADILVDGTQPKSAPCDALSVGMGFTADPVVLGGVSDAGVSSDGCAPASDPAMATCP